MKRSIFVTNGSVGAYLNQDAAGDDDGFSLSNSKTAQGLIGGPAIKTTNFNTFNTDNTINTDTMSTTNGGLTSQGTCCIANPADAIFSKVACQWDALKLSVNTMLLSCAESQDPCATKTTTTTAGKTAAGATGAAGTATPPAAAKSSSTGIIIAGSLAFVAVIITVIVVASKVKKGK